jgi:hypothetical protein
MNERIKELFNQAGGQGAIHPLKYNGTLDVEKFAEMIVKDFLSMCESERDGYLNLRKSTLDFDEKNIYAEGETACDRIRIMAKRRFGVE